MIFPGSRYANSGTYTITASDGTTVTALRIPLPRRAPVLGFHRRLEGQRLDLIANHYLADATQASRLCDASGTLAPDALAARDLIGIPVKAR
jgi:hypothetical protein